jgi:hypothetical protein
MVLFMLGLAAAFVFVVTQSMAGAPAFPAPVVVQGATAVEVAPEPSPETK